jgi:tetratricopeptide (TPR) repeat protein
VFITIVSFTFALITLISLRDWIISRSASRSLQKKLRLISQLISLQDWEKGEKELKILLEKGKGGKEAKLFEIQILRGNGLLQEALHKAEIQSRMFPEELQFRLEEARIHLAMGKPHAALAAFQVCAPILREESDLVSLASALCQGGYPQESLEILTPLLNTTQNGQVAGLAGDALYELRQFKEAIECYTNAIACGHQTHHILVQLGHAFRRYGNLAEAEKIFKGLLEKDGADQEATLGLGACLQERGHYHKALLIYQAALTALPQNVLLLYQAALAALRAYKFRVAETYFFEFLKTQKADPHTLSFYGLCLEHQKKWQEAEQVYLKLIQQFPETHYGFRALAWMFGVGLSQTVSLNQGLSYAHRALKLKNDSLSWEILSACAARTGDFEKAYQIQLSLAKYDTDPHARTRRQQVLRTLRKKAPLDFHQVVRSLVA